MALKIKWTKRATISFYRIIDYLIEEWGEFSAKKFISSVNRFLELLKSYPEIGELQLKEKGIRGYVITRQNTVLYRIKDDTVILLNFFDNRKHPKKKYK